MFLKYWILPHLTYNLFKYLLDCIYLFNSFLRSTLDSLYISLCTQDSHTEIYRFACCCLPHHGRSPQRQGPRPSHAWTQGLAGCHTHCGRPVPVELSRILGAENMSYLLSFLGWQTNAQKKKKKIEDSNLENPGTVITKFHFICSSENITWVSSQCETTAEKEFHDFQISRRNWI